MNEQLSFQTRGVVLVTRDIATLDWPTRAKAAGLTTIATHILPQEVVHFLATDPGQRFLQQCHDLGLQVEHELHAMGELLPRTLFDRNPGMFRMNAEGQRVREDNLCVHSPAALEVLAERTAHFTRLLPSTTGRCFYWGDDGKTWCRCPQCQHLSDSDQVKLLPWNREVFLADVELYATRGIRHVTQFATWLDGWYVEHFGEPSVDEYGAGLLRPRA